MAMALRVVRLQSGLLFAASCLLLAAPLRVCAQECDFVSFDIPGIGAADTLAINNAGQIAGS